MLSDGRYLGDVTVNGLPDWLPNRADGATRRRTYYLTYTAESGRSPWGRGPGPRDNVGTVTVTVGPLGYTWLAAGHRDALGVAVVLVGCASPETTRPRATRLSSGLPVAQPSTSANPGRPRAKTCSAGRTGRVGLTRPGPVRPAAADAAARRPGRRHRPGARLDRQRDPGPSDGAGRRTAGRTTVGAVATGSGRASAAARLVRRPADAGVLGLPGQLLESADGRLVQSAVAYADGARRCAPWPRPPTDWSAAASPATATRGWARPQLLTGTADDGTEQVVLVLASKGRAGAGLRLGRRARHLGLAGRPGAGPRRRRSTAATEPPPGQVRSGSSGKLQRGADLHLGGLQAVGSRIWATVSRGSVPGATCWRSATGSRPEPP
jgi:hypothetical protein